jgi:hypothetical protein
LLLLLLLLFSIPERNPRLLLLRLLLLRLLLLRSLLLRSRFLSLLLLLLSSRLLLSLSLLSFLRLSFSIPEGNSCFARPAQRPHPLTFNERLITQIPFGNDNE